MAVVWKWAAIYRQNFSFLAGLLGSCKVVELFKNGASVCGCVCVLYVCVCVCRLLLFTQLGEKIEKGERERETHLRLVSFPY